MAIIKSNVNKNSGNYISNYNHNKEIALDLEGKKNKIHKWA